MKKRHCINIDQCILIPMAAPIAWFIFLFGLFLVTLFISLAKGEFSTFFDEIANSHFLWLYLSGPISLVVFAIVSIAFIVFPVNYIELGDESVRIHKAFKKDRIIRYDEMIYVRSERVRKLEWAFVFIAAIEGGDIDTIEIRTNRPFPSLWLSASRKTYVAITEKLIAACSNKKEFVESGYYVAESTWLAEHGDPKDAK